MWALKGVAAIAAGLRLELKLGLGLGLGFELGWGLMISAARGAKAHFETVARTRSSRRRRVGTATLPARQSMRS